MMKIAAFVAWALAAIVLVVWLATGAPLVTRYQIPVTVVEEDEFDTVERTEMQDKFELGLLPDQTVDGVLPIVGFLGVTGLALFVVDRRRKAQA